MSTTKPSPNDVNFFRILNGTLSQMAYAANNRALFTCLMNVCGALEYGRNDDALEYFQDYINNAKSRQQ